MSCLGVLHFRWASSQVDSGMYDSVYGAETFPSLSGRWIARIASYKLAFWGEDVASTVGNLLGAYVDEHFTS